MVGDYEEDNKIKVVKVLARAASDQDFYQKLRNDPTKTLNDEGIDTKGKEVYIPDEKALKAILYTLECLGKILYKRS